MLGVRVQPLAIFISTSPSSVNCPPAANFHPAMSSMASGDDFISAYLKRSWLPDLFDLQGAGRQRT